MTVGAFQGQREAEGLLTIRVVSARIERVRLSGGGDREREVLGMAAAVVIHEVADKLRHT